MTWKIVTDSGCDLRHIEGLAEHTEFQNVPLTIQIGSEIFVDDEGLDVANMMTTMYASPVSSKSSCPSPDAFLQAYQGAENVQVIFQEVTIVRRLQNTCFWRNIQMSMFTLLTLCLQVVRLI